MPRLGGERLRLLGLVLPAAEAWRLISACRRKNSALPSGASSNELPPGAPDEDSGLLGCCRGLRMPGMGNLQLTGFSIGAKVQLGTQARQTVESEHLWLLRHLETLSRKATKSCMFQVFMVASSVQCCSPGEL